MLRRLAGVRRDAVGDTEPAPSHQLRQDPHEAMLGRDVPRIERQVERVEQLVHLLDLDRPALDDDAPRLAVRLAVGLERHRLAEHGGRQLGAFRGSEHDAGVIDHVVDGEDVGVIGDRDRQPSDLLRPQQVPALVLVELQDRGVELVRHGPTIRHVDSASYGRRS